MFEILEHTADIAFRARAGTLAELFVQAAEALISIAAETGSVEPVNSYELAAAGADRESLLVNWLNEVLYLFDGRRIAPRRFEVREISDTGVRGRALGEPWDPERHRAKLIVKGVTYHQLEVAERDGGWYAQVVLDI